MGNNKEKYEKLIDASILFSLDPEKEHIAYKREAQKMIEYLYKYLECVYKGKYKKNGLEIVETARRCINNYDSGSGRFLNYFSAAWANESQHISGDKAIEKRYHGLKFTCQEERNIKKYFDYFNKKKSSVPGEEDYAKIAEFMGISVEEVRRLSEVAKVTVTGEYVYNSEGEEVSVLDSIDIGTSIEDVFSQEESLAGILGKIDEVFNNLQERQKPLLSDLLTVMILNNVCDDDSIPGDYSFINRELQAEIIKTGKNPTQRDIANKYGKKEAHISRSINEFLKKVREKS